MTRLRPLPLYGLVLIAGCATEPLSTTSQEVLVPVAWTGAVGVAISGNDLTKTSGNGWNAGAVSTTAITGDGAVELTTAEADRAKMIGLSNGDTGQSYPDIDFALFLTSTGKVQVYEQGVLRGTFGAYAPSDLLRVEVLDGSVRYLRNGVVLFTSAQPPTFPLLVDTSLNHSGATLLDVRFGDATWWQNAVGVTVAGTSLTKTAPTGWNAGASSVGTLAGDGRIEFTTAETTLTKAVGLSNGDTNQSYTDIDFALFLNRAGKVLVYEQGTLRGGFGSYAAGDTFGILVVDGVVHYYHNGARFYTSAMSPTFPLVVDAALNHTGATIQDVRIITGSGLGPVIDGDYVIAGAFDLAMLAGVERITGNLTIASPPLDSIVVPDLEIVDGDLAMDSSLAGASVAMPVLRRVNDALVVTGSIDDVVVPALDHAGGLVIAESALTDLDDFASLTSLRSLSISQTTLTSTAGLANVQAELQFLGVNGVDGLSQLQLPGVTSIGGFVVGDSSLTDLSGLSSLSRIGTLDVRSNSALASVQLDQVDAIDYVWIERNPVLAVVGLNGAGAVRKATILNNPAIATVGFAQIETATRLDIIGNPALISIDLSSLQSTSSRLVIRNNGLLGLSFPALVSGGVQVTVIDNPSLTSLSAPALITITGTHPHLNVTGNAQLPICHATAIRDQLVANGWTGTALISGGVPCP